MNKITRVAYLKNYQKTHQKKYRELNKDKYKKSYHSYNNSQIQKDRIKKYKEEHKEKYRELDKIRMRKFRILALETLGNQCCKCGFSDYRALQIDHINGDGHKERKTGGFVRGNFHKHVVESFLKNENKYQLLCANCNWIKRSENNEIHHYNN